MNVFAAGESVFLRNWDYGYSYATTPATSKLTTSQVGVAPLPTFQGQSYPGYSNIGGWNMYINPHSKHIGLDLTFIKWLASNQAQGILATKYSEIPTTTAVRDSQSVINLNPVLAIVGKTRLSLAGWHAELPGTEHGDLHQRERHPRRIGVARGRARLGAEPGRKRAYVHIGRRALTRCGRPGRARFGDPAGAVATHRSSLPAAAKGVTHDHHLQRRTAAGRRRPAGRPP